MSIETPGQRGGDQRPRRGIVLRTRHSAALLSMLEPGVTVAEVIAAAYAPRGGPQTPDPTREAGPT